MRTNNRKPTTANQIIDKGYTPVFYNTNSGIVMDCNLQWSDEDEKVMSTLADDWNADKDVDYFDMAGMRILTSPTVKDMDIRKPNNRPGWIVAVMRRL